MTAKHLVRRLAGRLDAAGQAQAGRAYARLAALWRDDAPPEAREEIKRLFTWLAAWERARGTPLRELLLRLPRGLAVGGRGAVVGAAAARSDAPTAPHTRAGGGGLQPRRPQCLLHVPPRDAGGLRPDERHTDLNREESAP